MTSHTKGSSKRELSGLPPAPPILPTLPRSFPQEIKHTPGPSIESLKANASLGPIKNQEGKPPSDWHSHKFARHLTPKVYAHTM